MHKLIKEALENHFQLNLIEIIPLREFIGSLFVVKTQKKDYALKIYREKTWIDVKKVTAIMQHLHHQGVLVPEIVQTHEGGLTFSLGSRKAVLMTYVKGRQVSVIDDQIPIIETYKQIQKAMALYSDNVPKHGENFYIKRYINHLKAIDYDKEKIHDLKVMGKHLFSNVSQLGKGFMHGDFHSGNMVMTEEGLYILDFDACNLLSSHIDLLVAFNQLNFNDFRPLDFHQTKELIKKILSVDHLYLKKLMAFIPVRHYEIIATIIDAKGHDHIDKSFYDQQYKWIRTYYKVWLSL